MRLKPLLGLLIIAVLAGAAGYWYFYNNPDQWQQVLVDFGLQDIEVLQTEEQSQERPLTASGFIEAHEIRLASETGGRIAEMAVQEGDPVVAGQPLIQIETSLLDAQKEQIEAQIALADAQLAQLRAGTPEEAIVVAQAAVDLAEAEREAAQQVWQDAILLRDTPQQLNAQIDDARSKIQITQLQLQQAACMRNAVDLQEDIAKETWDLYQEYPLGDDFQASFQWNLATMDVWQGYITWESAQAAHESARSRLDTLLALKEEPLQAQLLVTQAQADYQAKVAAVAVAQANLDQLQAPVSDAQIQALEANRDQARAQLLTLLAELEKYIVVSPNAGVVVKKTAHKGEIATPGIPLLAIANLDTVTLTVYVADSDYGRLQEGQSVAVSVDSYPQKTFGGLITRISDEAEFTPKNVQTPEERVSLVYAVEIRLANEDHSLKPGMPADVAFIDARPR